MEQLHSRQYPTIEENQFDLNKALISLLNCRRYIHSRGFQELFENSYNTNGIAGGYAEIVFPIGSTVSDANFRKTSNKDLLIQEMILKEVRLKMKKGYSNYERSRVVTNKFKKDGFEVLFGVRDTTKEKLGFFERIGHDAEMFALVYRLTLNKDLIRDSDMGEFINYREGLDDVVRESSLLNFTSNIQPRASLEDKEETKPETEFINPWEIDVPKLGEDD